MLFRQLFDAQTSTYTYLIADESTKEAVLVDPVIEQVDRDYKLIKELGLNLYYCIETHIHADHITAAYKLRKLTGCLGVVPAKAKVTCADIRIEEGDNLGVGGVNIEVISTPGHTSCHMAYLVGEDRVLTGDALFIRGCGRTDFQSGDAGTLYDSVTQKLFTLPDETLVYPAHDYRGNTVSTIGEEKQFNSRFTGCTSEQYIELMNNLDLPNPKKIMEAVPANEMCGKVAA